MKQAKRSSSPAVSPAPQRVRQIFAKVDWVIAFTGLLGAGLAFMLLGRSVAEWKLPLMYSGDAVNVMAIAQMGIERLWASGSDRLGAPGVLDLAYYPMPEYGQLFLIKATSLLGLDASETINGYFFLTFVLAGSIAAWALRTLGARRPLALLGGLAFTLLPCHFWRGTSHMFVNGYYLVPAMCYVLLRPSHDRRTFYGSAALCAISPLINTYYSFFFCFLLASTCILDAIGQRSRAPIISALKMLGFLMVGFVANMSRSLPLYWAHKIGFVRPPQDSELYGLKLTQMVLPAFATVSEYLRGVETLYNRSAPLVTENKWNDLGLLVACAFLLTFAYGFLVTMYERFRSSASMPHDLFRRAAACSLLSIVYGTIGGISALFSYAVSPLIRSSNRIEVYIAFFSIAVAVLMIQHFIEARATAALRPAVEIALCVVCALILVWDTSQKDIRPDFDRSDAIYKRDAEFFARLEGSLPEGARVFQMPHLVYPEAGLGEPDYDYFRAYIHTQKMVWSFGAVRTVDAENDNRRAESMLMGGQLSDFRAYLTKHHFSGILLSRKVAGAMRGKVENVLNETFGAPTQHDAMGEFVFYPLARQ